MDEIEVNGKKYVLKSKTTKAPRVSPVSIGKRKPVVVRTNSAGVFVGYLYHREGTEVLLKKARRIHYLDGAASLSELAMRGVSKPQNCRFPAEVDWVLLTGVIELLPMTKEAKDNIDAVPVWTKPVLQTMRLLHQMRKEKNMNQTKSICYTEAIKSETNIKS